MAGSQTKHYYGLESFWSNSNKWTFFKGLSLKDMCEHSSRQLNLASNLARRYVIVQGYRQLITRNFFGGTGHFVHPPGFILDYSVIHTLF